MFGLLRALVMLVVLAAAAAFFLGYRWSDFSPGGREVDRPAVEGESRPLPSERERGEGAGDAVGRTAEQAGQRAAEAASQAGEILSDAALTAKIKSKMALDDHVSAGTINVNTANGRVTLTGRVSSDDERRRAVELARDTRGVQSVDDRLTLVDR